jgi:hypothetical protein
MDPRFGACPKNKADTKRYRPVTILNTNNFVAVVELALKFEYSAKIHHLF